VLVKRNRRAISNPAKGYLFLRHNHAEFSANAENPAESNRRFLPGDINYE
jgi:hypothetical protein